jgi:hypothetical protein
MARHRLTKRVAIRPGQAAIAPRVDRPLGFGVENAAGRPLTVSFSYDDRTHVMTATVEEDRAKQRAPTGLPIGPGNGHEPGEQPA